MRVVPGVSGLLCFRWFSWMGVRLLQSPFSLDTGAVLLSHRPDVLCWWGRGFLAGPQPPHLSPDTATLLLALCEVTETAPSAAASLGVLPAGVAAALPPAALVPGPAQQSSGTRCPLCFFVAGPSLPQPQALCLRGPEPVFSPLPWGSGRTCDGSESAKPFIWAPQCILHSFLDQSWQQGTKGIWSVLCDSVASHRSNPTSAIGQRAPGLACWRKQT